MAARTVTLGGNGELFIGEDKTLRLELVETEYDSDGVVVEPHAGSVPVNMSGWVITIDIRSKDTSPDPAILSRNATVSGVYNATRSVNTQRALVALTDDDTNLFKQKVYRYSWKRMDAGVETVLVRGPFTPEKATAP